MTDDTAAVEAIARAPRLSIEHINRVLGDLAAYRSSGHQAPKELLFQAADAIGALGFDAIDYRARIAKLREALEKIDFLTIDRGNGAGADYVDDIHAIVCAALAKTT